MQGDEEEVYRRSCLATLLFVGAGGVRVHTQGDEQELCAVCPTANCGRDAKIRGATEAAHASGAEVHSSHAGELPMAA